MTGRFDMHGNRRIARVVRVILVAGMCAAATGNRLVAQDARRSAADMLDEGNAQLESGHYQTALESYDRAAEVLPDSPEIAYNRGLALYRLGRFQEAQTAFQDALRPDRPDIEARAKFNLGRSAHESAIGKQDQDVQAAVNDLTKAIGFYRDAEQLSPQDADARTNREAAERLRRYLEYLMQQQQQQQQQDKSDEQNPTSQPDQQPTSQPDQTPQSQPASQPGEQQDQKGQQGDQEQPQDARQQQQEQQQDDAGSDAAEDGEGKSGEPSDPKDAKESKDDQQTERRLKEEQVEPMLQEARDMERRRREARRQRMMRMRGRIPVEKDW